MKEPWERGAGFGAAEAMDVVWMHPPGVACSVAPDASRDEERWMPMKEA